ncbi:hypothetical protein KJ806_03485 [Patescibacteria group bacterium]|nr:hypothetical protein [Patescibacteria group bacterium]
METFLAEMADNVFSIGATSFEKGKNHLESFKKIQGRLGMMADLVSKLKSELGLDLLARG